MQLVFPIDSYLVVLYVLYLLIPNSKGITNTNGRRQTHDILVFGKKTLQ